MKIKISPNGFVKALSLACSVVSPHATLPILSNVLIETYGKDQVRLVATDLEIAIACSVAVEILEEGSVTAPAKKLFDIIRELPQEPFEISVGKNHAIQIRGERASFRLIGLPHDDFPKVPTFTEGKRIEIEQNLLKECLNLTAFAISHDETRYVLNGLLLMMKNGKLKLVGTDGRRLAVIEKALPSPLPWELEVILPSKTIQELNKILSGEGTIQIALSNNQLLFELENVILISRIVEGHFPNYEQVIPKQEKTKSTAVRETLLAALRRASLLASPESQAVKMDFSKSKIILSSKSAALGESKEEVDAEVTGQDLAIGFNPHYLMDALKNLEEEQISLSLSDSDKPGVLQGKEGYLYVIMPMQLN